MILLHQMLDKSQISMPNFQLEKEIDPSKSTYNINDVLGQFLRFLHLILICMLHEESKLANMYPTNPNNNDNHAKGTFFDRQSYL